MGLTQGKAAMGRKNDDPPLSFTQYAILRVAHQAGLRLDRERLPAREREKCLYLVRLGEQVLRTLEREQIASPDPPPAAAAPHPTPVNVK
jgi:hypothetical protein